MEPLTDRKLLARSEASAEKRSLLLIHFGDPQFRGSERCALNILQGGLINEYKIHLWTNHRELAEKSSDVASEIILAKFPPAFGFDYASNYAEEFLSLLKTIREARTVLKRTRPSLIICNSLAPCQWVAHLSVMYRIPLLTYLHTNYLPKSRFFSFAYASSCIVAVSEFALRPFRNDGYPNTRAMIIYNGVDDLAEVKPSKDIGLREELGIEPDEFLVMSLSALVDWKKVDLIIEAFKIVERAPGKRFVLVVVGDGPRLEALKELGRGHRIIFCGWRSDIANVMGSADCVAVASEKEAFALNILEAASMSIPVIGANAGGIREAIVDRETGFLVEPGSAQGFAKAILALQNDPNLCRAIGKKAREAFELKFRVQRMQSDMNGLINVLASKKEPIAPRFWRLFHLSAMLLVRLFLSKRVRK